MIANISLVIAILVALIAVLILLGAIMASGHVLWFAILFLAIAVAIVAWSGRVRVS